jgi:hypothetical protein
MQPKVGNTTINHLNHLKGLIKNYSSETILKEYLQNADDAGATELIVTYDKQTHNNLRGTVYEDIACPSLLLSNNSKFKDKDFESILELYAENKIEDSQSTGRFGLGFRSSYSITDYPSFFSLDRVIWLDELQKTICKETTGTYASWDKNSFSDNNMKKWLRAFKVVGYDESDFFDNTIFRLPLRTEETALTSKLSSEIFSFDKFLVWCEEWKEGARDLLFLRNINRLVLQEIDESGSKIIHLEIQTKNKDIIEDIRNKINSSFLPTAQDTCNQWLRSKEELPKFIYSHQFNINYYDRDLKRSIIKIEKWAVINGIFRGENNSLLKQANEALLIKSNVLPWVGVAIQLDKNDSPIVIDGGWYTFLPLFKSKYPVLLHGWFDLDNGRTKIIHDGSGDELEILKKWNELLLEEGIGVAWALLLNSLKDKISISTYYKFWVKNINDSKIDSILESFLINGFYTKLAELNCLYTIHKEKESWLSPKDNNLYYFKDEKNQILLDAFKEHFPIVYPKPQNFIIENFKKVGVELIEITPEFIRDYLQEESKDIDFPVNIEKIPITMLQKKEWLIEIIKYCADNEEDYNLLNGLPVKLTLDKNIYKVGSDTLFDKSPNLKLFQDMKYLYIDTNIVNLIDNIDTLPNSWLHSTLENQIKLLSKTDYWENITITKEWLEEIVNVITNSTQEEFNEAEDIIKELQLVYQENNEYGKLESKIDEYSPFMPRDEDIENNLIYLDEISMNVVHHEYAEIYKPFLKYEGLITKLTSKTLIQHLLLLYSFDFFKKKETREYLIDILTENITWLDELTSNQISTLYYMPFIETVADNIYSKDTEIKLFLPTNFTPPKHIKSLEGEYELVAVARNSNLYELYLKMGLTEQKINSYIQEIIIPFLKNSDSFEDKKEVLKWLSVEWKNIKDNIEEQILEELQESSIIPSLVDEQKLYKAFELYIPTVELGEIFNDALYMPLSFSDEEVQVKWIALLSDLGSSKDILPQHIITKVKKIVEADNQLLAIDLLNFIANNFEIFEQMDILDTLKEYAWFPVEEPRDLLKPKNEYTPLKKADELILFDKRKIVGGYYHILDRRVNLGKKDEQGDYSEENMAKKLGIITNIANESFFESFRELMKLSPQNGEVVNYTKDVYKYIGRRFNRESIDFDIEERTILINNQWVSPKYVYQEDKLILTTIYNWSCLVGNDIESNLAKGLILLGVQKKQTLDFLREQLNRLPQEKSLDPNQLKDAKALLHEIQNKDENLFTDLVLLTKDNQLIISSKLYINDLEAYKNSKDKNDNLLFVSSQFERLLAKRLNVTSLNENWTSKLDSYKECESSFTIDRKLKEDVFKKVILRLLYHENKIEEHEINEEKLDNILPSQIIFTNQLIIEYSIKETFLYRSNETTYEDKNENCLYIFEQDDNEDMIEAITEYICKAMSLNKYNLLIARILRESMNQLEINIFLEKKKIKLLPQEFDIEEIEVSTITIPQGDEKIISKKEAIITLGTTEKAFNEIKEISDNFYHTTESSIDKLEYIQGLLRRAKENVIKHLNTLEEYNCDDIEDSATTVLSGILKNNEDIYIIPRPSDGGQVIIFHSSEFDTLEYANSELWYEDGNSIPKKLTLGKILKDTKINRIPV